MKARNIAIGIALLCATLCASAQEMKVTSFRLLESDLTANLHGTTRIDQNGDKAALIKIVAPDVEGLVFDGGELGIVATEQKAGEVWVYVPQRAQKISITHKTFGRLDNYVYPISIDPARTYEMLLNVGTGRFVTINCSRANSDVELDGQPIGKSPITHMYMSYGEHTLKATNGRFEGVMPVVLTSISEEQEGPMLLNVEMEDQSFHYGDVTVEAPNNVAIYFEGEHVADGTWRTQLYEGNYEVETRAPECDPFFTPFTVVAQQQNNVQAVSPIPFTGKLYVATSRRKAKAVYDGMYRLALSDSVVLPTGTYQVEVERSGFKKVKKEYTIGPKQTVTDSIVLQRDVRFKRYTFYAGGAIGVHSNEFPEVSVGGGLVIYGIDLNLNWGWVFNDEFSIDDNWKETFTSWKLGYQLNAGSTWAFTPQIGACTYKLKRRLTDTNTVDESGKAKYVTLGLRALAAAKGIAIYFQPELNISNKKDRVYKLIANEHDIDHDGFGMTVGLLIHF